jgi:gamma-glutamyltranspeptidase / glutathione hydrolase
MMRRLLAVVVLAAVLAAAALTTASAKEGSRFRPAVSGRLGVVATENEQAARVGRRVLERGGNAIDAAASTVFAMGVSRPQSCGLGGGGFLVYRGRTGRAATLDFRETAPAAFAPQTLQGPGLHKTFTGHLTVGAPGVVRGMAKALRRYGTISLARAIAPAERMARRGVTVTPALSESMAENADRLKLFPAAARQYLIGSERPYPAGSTLRQPDMATSLSLIRRKGPRAFYRGRIARLIAAEMRRARRNPIPGDAAVMRRSDLTRYRAKWRRPLLGSFRGRGIVAMPPPTSGGIAVLEMLNILEGYDLKGMGQSSADALHLIAEAQKLAWADRAEYVGDPDFVRVPTGTLISKSYAARRRSLIDMEHAGNFGPGLGPYQPGSTTHISIVDRRGNSVAVTCTIEQEFGSAVVAPGTGFLLNNEMTDFGTPGTANESRAFKRPRSSMSPTIVTQNGRPIDVTGGAGGSLIVMGTFFSVLNRVEYGLDLAHAVDAERIDAQQEPGGPIMIEDARIDPAVIADLEARGHTFMSLGEYGERPRVQAAGYRSPSGGPLKDAVSDPRAEAGSLAERP